MQSDNTKEAQLASAALAVALTALAIAVIQLFGQFFATADGYRRCQPSVMGAWARYTKLRWKWSEMRFETLFTTPEILLLNFKPLHDPLPKPAVSTWRQDYQWISENPGAVDDGISEHGLRYRSIDCLDSKLVDENLGSGMRDEMACWLPFLNSIRESESQFQWSLTTEDSSKYHTLRRPACRLVQRSWDFMAPELVRPLAMTYIGDIAIIVLRLGMRWQTFRPEDGEMRAEGNEHIIYSTLDRSIGPILHYARGRSRIVRYTEKSGNVNRASSVIPTKEADMMNFGILPCYEGLMGRKSYSMGTFDEVHATLDILDPTGSASKKVRDNRNFEAMSTYGFSDLIPTAAPMLRQKGDPSTLLPAPTEHCIGLCSLKEGFVVFRQRLAEYIVEEGEGVSEQTRWVLRSYNRMRRFRCWEDGIGDSANGGYVSNLSFLDEVYEGWEETTRYFEKLSSQDDISFRYADLVACHIKHAVNFWHEAHERIREEKQRHHHGLTDWLVEGMHLYWDYLPKIAEALAYQFSAPQSLIREAWIMLMFRAFCWSRSHHMCHPQERFPESTRLPSRYWDSRLPVYLG
ncbi:MAG: hypothetical protein LQ341_006174 [Variospora aurantia]|nr:MAG: hypothetical protein LQ341_006174 [Variospora aurantia]